MARLDLENLKSVQMAVRMTIKERDEIDRKCKELGVKPSEYLRDHTVRLYDIQPLLYDRQEVQIVMGRRQPPMYPDRIPFHFMRKAVKNIYTVRDIDRIYIELEEE